MARGIAIAVDRTASWWLCTLVASLPSLLLVGWLPIPWTQYQQRTIKGQVRGSGKAVPGQYRNGCFVPGLTDTRSHLRSTPVCGRSATLKSIARYLVLNRAPPAPGAGPATPTFGPVRPSMRWTVPPPFGGEGHRFVHPSAGDRRLPAIR